MCNVVEFRIANRWFTISWANICLINIIFVRAEELVKPQNKTQFGQKLSQFSISSCFNLGNFISWVWSTWEKSFQVSRHERGGFSRRPAVQILHPCDYKWWLNSAKTSSFGGVNNTNFRKSVLWRNCFVCSVKKLTLSFKYRSDSLQTSVEHLFSIVGFLIVSSTIAILFVC